jgi:hypothetical protein
MKYLLIVFLLFCSFLSYGQNIQQLVESSNNHVRAMFNQAPKHNHLIVPNNNNSVTIGQTVQNVQHGVIVNNFNNDISSAYHLQQQMFNYVLEDFLRTNDKSMLPIPSPAQGIINNPNQNLYRKNTTVKFNTNGKKW